MAYIWRLSKAWFSLQSATGWRRGFPCRMAYNVIRALSNSSCMPGPEITHQWPRLARRGAIPGQSPGCSGFVQHLITRLSNGWHGKRPANPVRGMAGQSPTSAGSVGLSDVGYGG